QNPPSAATKRITDEILKTTKNMTPTECHPWELHERKKGVLVDLYANKKKAKSTISSNEPSTDEILKTTILLQRSDTNQSAIKEKERSIS
ncbi:11534_t:CDS:1, partial [Gigaspora margarita]